MEDAARLEIVTPLVDGPAFESFFRAEYGRLCEALYLLTRDPFEAEELAQETMTRVLERWDRVSRMDSPVGYTYRTALNLNHKRLRRIAVRARKAFAAIPSEDHSKMVGDQHDVQQALSKLPAGQREALVLVDWLAMDSEQAGRVLGIEANSVRVRIHRARSSLRRQLGGDA
ncbi:MAG: sigma-70 family RNA polymerase sigma factor [Actinomycetota bacterium]|nr:sigma-70 family RNA polymerase sigma factor [Actinomycetota bacterium]